jgi:GT2 family glycosyltransferase
VRSLARTLYLIPDTLRRGLAGWIVRGIEDADRRGGRLPWSFRVMLGVYLLKRFLQQALVGPAISTGSHWRAWKREMVSQYLIKLHQYSVPTEVSRVWFEPYLKHRTNDAPTAFDLERQREAAGRMDRPELISIITPAFNTPARFLEPLADSVLAQTFPRWEWIIVDDGSTDAETLATLDEIASLDPRIRVERIPANVGVSNATNRGVQLARGEFLAFVDHDDELCPDALFEMAARIHREPTLDLLYSDEELLPEWEASPYPHFKPALSPELLTSYNYICHLLVLRRSLFEAVGRLRPEFDGAQDHDLILRVIRTTDRVAHIPRILYRWRVTKKSFSRFLDPKSKTLKRVEANDVKNVRAVQEHFDELGVRAVAESTHMGWLRPKYPPVNRGKVSILICTKDKPDLITACVRSIETKTDYPNHEIIVVDNGSTTPAAEQALAEIGKRHRVLRIENGPEGFNFARLNNEAARQATGDWVLFLNDDTEVIRPDWLSAMVGMGQLPGIGAVGARLLLPGRKLQHAGLIVGTMGWGPWHALYDAKADRDFAMGYMTYPHNAIAVTAACMLTRRELFLELGGFDEVRFGVAFNDVDYCLRLHQRGLRCGYVPEAELFHYESRTRGRGIQPIEAANLRAKYAGIVDPYWNPNYSRDHGFVVSSRRVPRYWPGDRPRALVVSPQVSPGEPWRTSAELAGELAERGVLEFERFVIPAGVHHDRWIIPLCHALSEGGFNVVLAEGPEARPAVELAHGLGISALWHLPNRIFVGERLSVRRVREFLAIQDTFAKAYQVVFDNLHSLLLAGSGILRDNFARMDSIPFEPRPHPVVSRAAKARSPIRTVFGIGAEQVVFLTVMPADDFDGLDTIARGFERLGELAERAFLLVVLTTDNPAHPSAERARTLLHPRVKNAAVAVEPEATDEHFAVADLYVAHPQLTPRPRATVRAMEAGLAILGHRDVLSADLIHEGANGLSFKPFSARQLAQHLSLFVRHPELIEPWGRASRDWFDSRSEPRWLLEQWRNLFQEAAELSRRPGESLASPDSDLVQRIESDLNRTGTADVR